jgi:penicillin-binding protein 1A
MIQNPNGYDPLLRPEAARQRRSEVLARMVVYHDISATQAAAAAATPLPTKVITPGTADGISDYYVQQVRNQLLSSGSPVGATYAQRYAALFRGSLRIFTNLDPADQRTAERSVAAGTPASGGRFEQALVSLDPRTGAVRALVGGLGTHRSQFDIITQGTRQPGSGFKLFTLLAALERGYSLNDTVDGQSPCAIGFPTDPYLVHHPARNDEGAGGGIMTLLAATAQSTNCAYIRLAHEVGLGAIIAMAHRLGIQEPLPPYPSIVIGSIAVQPLEMAAAYAAVADGGIYHPPTFINRILTPAGRTVYRGGTPGRLVLSLRVSAEADVALEAVVKNGTGKAAAIGGRPLAGKTGTTSNNVDAWFNGYTPQLETTVWMGNLQTELPMTSVGGIPVYGGTYPAATWRLYMATALAHDPWQPFPRSPRLPRGRYITSRALVADDVLNHNRPPPPAAPRGRGRR